jgi:hypothetical protein
MFLGVFAPIVLYGLRLARRERGAHAARIVAGALPVNPACSVPGTVVVASVLAALVLLMPLLPALANSDGKSREVSRLPDDTGGYFRISAPEPAWLPTIPGAQAEFAMYESGGVRIAVYRGGFPSQDVNERLIGGGSSFVGDAYGTSAANVRSIAAPEGKFDVTEYRGRDERGDLVILTWFEIGDYRAHSRFVAKLLELPARLAGRSDAWYLAVSSACAESCDATAQVLDRFLVEAAVDIRAQFTVLPLLVE